jgi:hypothetical protein
MAKIHAERARALVGVPFRPQGRDACLGLDCAGLALAAFGLPPDLARRDYRLRGNHRSEIETALRRHFRKISRPQGRAGDLLLLTVGHEQFHLAVLTTAGFVHADARLGRVVETPGRPHWKVSAAYRRRVRGAGR